MKAINEDKLMYKFCYKCPGDEEVRKILDDRKYLAPIFKKLEGALRVTHLIKSKAMILSYKETHRLERYILALEIVEENAVSKLNKIKEVICG